MKTVAIVGAGPSGLVMAKTLLRSRSCRYKVTIFEKTSELGGLWAVHRERPHEGMLNPEMPTNVSRFNIGFTDLAWQSVGLEGHIPYWPKAWQAGHYLRAYADRFLPSDCFRYNTKVISASANSDKSSGDPTWKLVWETQANDGETVEEEGCFDYLVVASGFFNRPNLPKFLEEAPGGIKVVHSSKLRSLMDVLPEREDCEGVILVVGGGMSGADGGTVVSTHLSHAKYSPEGSESKYGNVKITQICSEPAYALPLAASSDNEVPGAPRFLPLDLCFYRLETRPEGPITMAIGQTPKDVLKGTHAAFQGLVGDQSTLSNEGLTMDDNEKAAYVTLTEQYGNFIRSGEIQILAGHLKSLKPGATGSGQAVATISTGTGIKTVENVLGIVCATGYSPQPSLDFLSEELQKKLERDAAHNRLPIILEEYGTLRSDIPRFAVVGYHEGAFWGSMEMEARYVERKWSQSESANDHSISKLNGNAAEAKESLQRLRDLRDAMTARKKDVPQYWAGDYVGLMEELARATDTERDDKGFGGRNGPVVQARYAETNGDLSETEKMSKEVLEIIQGSQTKALYVARAAFLGLQGYWNINRKIDSHINTMPSGNLTGTAAFHFRFPTDPKYTFEYLYVEKGEFNMSNGAKMNATRRYVYRYNEEEDKITVWFVKEDGKTVDYLYHGLEIDPSSRSEKGWLAKADHLCVKDMYVSDYRFRFRGSILAQLTVTHEVKGPSKDYVSETVYLRN